MSIHDQDSFQPISKGAQSTLLSLLHRRKVPRRLKRAHAFARRIVVALAGRIHVRLRSVSPMTSQPDAPSLTRTPPPVNETFFSNVKSISTKINNNKHKHKQVWHDVGDPGVSPDSMPQGAARRLYGLRRDNRGGAVGHPCQGLRPGSGRGPAVRAAAVQVSRALGKDQGGEVTYIKKKNVNPAFSLAFVIYRAIYICRCPHHSRATPRTSFR